ncbi:hypothetical protein P5G86_24215 [Paenibacillus jamilae]|uniref:hypothetical protein n=1 Tax=Bacillus cereus group TaxID=86661 RepID=UPI001298A64E|nr:MULTISPECIES: hypothetical protein [Bacillus cereus group]MEB4843099.1 hypothetical protein [Paenibacillus jamilae]MEB8831001.1 hypothetical protein [Bacillus cereus]MCR6856591.1 hypothetical protein [Bacillus thuringiensis]MEB9274822.1 hypothetical protein [Bacillus cereus]MEC3037285.1 hypothetical protein [Bacillus cereus]
MDRKLLIKYILYFSSYLLVYIAAYPILFVLVMAGDNPYEDHLVLDWIIIGFEVLVTLFGSWLLNFIFRKSVNLKWKDKYSLMVFISHLFLIPLTWRFLLNF